MWRAAAGQRLGGAGIPSDGEDGALPGLGQGLCVRASEFLGEMVGEVVQAVSIYTSLRRWALKGWRGT